jgi:hypothetical protein
VRASTRAFVVTIAVGLGCTLASSWASAVAPAVREPLIIVRPSEALHNRQIVVVRGTGFKARDDVYIVECLRGARGASQCDLATATFAVISSKGVLPPTHFTAVTGKIGTGVCGTRAANVAKCDVSVGTASGSDAATAPITFVAPKTK